MNLRAENESLRETLAQHRWWIVYGFLAVFLLLLSIVSIVAWSISQPKGRVTCASFGSYIQMHSTFLHGAMQLDGNHNGIPCESHKYPDTPH